MWYIVDIQNDEAGKGGTAMRTALVIADGKMDSEEKGLPERQDGKTAAAETGAGGMVCESPLGDRTAMRASFQVKISREKGFYGPGVHLLLQLTEKLGSLSNACQYMGMSYTKGRKLIRTMEQQLGVPVLKTRQGGRDGGYSHLTEEAKKMVDSYSAFQAEAESVLQEIFQRHFSETTPQ